MGDLLPRWVGEIEAAGSSVAAIGQAVDAAVAEHPAPSAELSPRDTRAVVGEVLVPDGALASRKVFTRRT
ncbi:MAG: hypothetical protein ACR2LJ_09670 [Acidimicrobiales bacterium]